MNNTMSFSMHINSLSKKSKHLERKEIDLIMMLIKSWGSIRKLTKIFWILSSKMSY